MNKYFTIAYDKNKGVFTTMSTHQSFDYAKRVASSLEKLCRTKNLRRNGNGDPYTTAWVEDAERNVVFAPNPLFEGIKRS